MANKKPSILWLSDIHYKELKEATDEQEEDLISAYINSLTDLIKKTDFSHIIITGDLVFGGKIEQYKSLYKNFIEKIWDYKKNTRLIVIPGNHDVDYDKDKDIENILKKLVGKDSYEKKEDFISTNDKLFDELFENYQIHFNEFIKMRLKDLEDDKKIKIYKYLDTKGLYGIIHDIEYNIIFNCFNTSWICLGNDILHKNIKEDIKNDREELNAFLDNMSYGNIIIGELARMRAMFEKNINSIEEEECSIISCMHHPISWLHYKLLYDVKNDFDWLIDKTDILLTGHLHLPYFLPNIYRQNTYVFEAPQLLDYKLYKNFKNVDGLKFGYNTLAIDYSKNQFSVKNISYPVTRSGKIEGSTLTNREFDFSAIKKGGAIRKIAKRKSILFDFSTQSDIDDFFDLNSIKQECIYVPNKDLDFYEKHCQLLSSLPEFENTIKEDTIKRNDRQEYVAAYDKNKCAAIIFQNPNSNKNELLTKFLEQITFNILEDIGYKNNESLNLKILFYDCWVFQFNIHLNISNKIKDPLQRYQYHYCEMKKFFTILRYKIFNENDFLDNVSLSFEIINLELYLDFFRQ